MLKNRLFYLFSLCLLGILYIFSNSYFMLILLLILITAPVFSLAVFLFALPGLRLEIELDEGKEPGIIYSVHNLPRIFPAILAWEVEIEHFLAGEFICHSLQQAAFAGGKEKLALKLGNLKTGRLEVRTRNIKAVDILKLFHKSMSVLSAQEILIYPQLFEVDLIISNEIEAYGDSLEYSQSNTGNDVNEIFSLHEYTEGDELRRVHWKLSSKMESLMVRDFGLPLNHPVLLLLDLVRTEQTESGRLPVCIDAFISLSAALLEKGICHNIAWLNAGPSSLSVEEVLNMEDLQLHLPAILSAVAYDKDNTALLHYQQMQDANRPQFLYYITSFYPSSMQTDLFAGQRCNVLLVGGGDSLLGKEGLYSIPFPLRDDFLLRLVS